MKHSAGCLVDGIRQLLPEFSAAGVMHTATVAAGAAGIATGGAVPIVLTGALILAQIGLNYQARKSEAKQAEDLRKALDILQRHAKKEDVQLDDISGELEVLGFDLRFDLEKTLKRLEEIEGLVKLQGGSDQEILEYLQKHDGLFLSLGGFLEENFDELLAAGVELQGTVDDVKAEMAEQRKLMVAVKEDTSALREGQTDILDATQRLEAAIKQITENYIAQLGQRDTEIASLRKQVHDAIMAKVEAERAAGGSVDAMLERLRRGDPEELLEFLDQRVADHESQLIEHHRERAAVAYVVGDIDRALDSINRILALLPDDLDAINRLGVIFDLRGELSAAETQYRKLLELAPDDDAWRDAAYGNLGVIHHTRGELDEAEKMFRKALTTYEKLGRLEDMASAYANLGLIYQTRGELDEAEVTQRKALAIFEKLGCLKGMASAYGNLGVIHHKRGELDEAEKMHHKSLAIHEKLGYRQNMAVNYGNLGLIHRRQDDLDEAETMLRKALAIDKKLGNREGMARDCANLGLIYRTRGELDEARRLWIQSRDLFAQLAATHMVEKLQGWIDEFPSE